MRAIIQKTMTPDILPWILHAGRKLLGVAWDGIGCAGGAPLLNALHRVILMAHLEHNTTLTEIAEFYHRT